MELEEGFPRINIGHCDGMGCGHAEQPCWCEENHEMILEFQRQYKRAWDGKDPICKAWEESFRFFDKRWRKLVKAAEIKFYGKKKVGGTSDFMFTISRASD